MARGNQAMARMERDAGDRRAAAEFHRRRTHRPLAAAIPHHHHLGAAGRQPVPVARRSEEHTSELQSLMRISYDGFCLKKKIHHNLDTNPESESQYTRLNQFTISNYVVYHI